MECAIPNSVQCLISGFLMTVDFSEEDHCDILISCAICFIEDKLQLSSLDFLRLQDNQLMTLK